MLDIWPGLPSEICFLGSEKRMELQSSGLGREPSALHRLGGGGQRATLS